ncbi:MAG: TIGR04168 family protein, partial [Thermosynechococcaceae cyanobacterium]
NKEDRVKQQMALLSHADTSYCHRDFDTLSVVGGRPFSWGGSEWRFTDFYSEWFGVHNFEESAQRIENAANAAAHDTLIFLGHNGPAGLGKEPEDTCGKDWRPIGGDYGDPDLATAISAIKACGKSVPLVAFGHMHHSLRHTKEVLRTRVCIEDGTVYLNAACVPRIIETETGALRNFSVVTLQNHQVTEVHLVWVDAEDAIASAECLYKTNQAAEYSEISGVRKS